jgi:hypothetical protein
MGTTAPGIRAFHGSPYSFERFDPAAIGTGEGAQAYGHGLYFAEKEGTAQSYRDALAPQGVKGTGLSSAAQDWLKGVNDDVPGATVDSVRQYAIQMHNPYDPDHPDNDISKEILGAIDQGRLKNITSGHMYEVNINVDPAHMLDWDKPLTEQSQHVQDALESTGQMDNARQYFDANKRMFPPNEPPTGADLHNVLEMSGYQPWQIAEKLRDAGIPGISYLDQGSRAAGEGTRNHVVFNPDTIDILRKYGIAGLMTGAAGVGAAATAGQPQTDGAQPGPSAATPGT